MKRDGEKKKKKFAIGACRKERVNNRKKKMRKWENTIVEMSMVSKKYIETEMIDEKEIRL